MTSAVKFVFVSSTWMDLIAERNAVNDALHRMATFKPVAMEYFGSRDESTREVSLVEVDRSDVYVLILGGRFGSGITELEYRRAIERGLDCFVYSQSESTIVAEWRDAEPDKRTRLAAFKAELSGKHTVAAFDSPADLAAKVTADMHRWFTEKFSAAAAKQQDIYSIAEDGKATRLADGSAHGMLVYREQPVATEPRLRPLPLEPSVFRVRGLLDRTAEKAAATKALETSFPVELYGQPGAGKSALLSHLAYSPAAEANPDGVVYLEKVGHQPLPDLLQQLFESFYENDPPLKPTPANLKSLLNKRRALLVLDDVSLTQDEIKRVMNTVPNCNFVLASAERRLPGDSQGIAIAGLPATDAQQLFERELGRACSPEEAETFSRLYALLEGQPLRLLQAAMIANDKRWTVADLVTQLPAEQPAEALHWLGIVGRPEAEQQVLAVLAALDGADANAAALAAISGHAVVEPLLEDLSSRRLIESSNERYRLAGASLVLLSARWDLNGWRERALKYFTEFAERNQNNPAAIQDEEEAITNLLAWAAQNGRPEETKRLARAAEPALALTGRWEVWGKTLESLRTSARATNDRATEAYATHQLGTRAMCMDDSGAARELLNEALKQREALGDYQAVSVTRHNLDYLLPRPVPLNPPKATGGGSLGLVRGLLVGGIVLVGGLLAYLGLRDTTPPLPTVKLSFNPASIEFTIKPDSTLNELVSVTAMNMLPEALRLGTVAVTGASASAFQIVDDRCSNTALAPKGSCKISVTFKPSPQGEHTASVLFVDPANQTLAALPARGVVAKPEPSPSPSPTATVEPTPNSTPEPTPTGTPVTSATSTPAPRVVSMSIAPTALRFGEQILNESAARELTIKNTGNVPLANLSLTVSGTHASDFTLPGRACGQPLAPQKQCTISIAFKPAQLGERQAALRVTSNAPNSPQDVTLSGTGIPRPVASPPTINPPRVDFGRAEFRGTPVERTVTITNNGAAPYRIGQFSGKGNTKDFAPDLRDCNRALPSGASCTLTIAFVPQGEGLRQLSLNFTDNTAASRGSITLFGTGLAARLSFDPPNMTFDGRKQTQRKTVKVVNSGSAPLRISDLNIAPDQPEAAGVYSIEGTTCQNTVVPAGRSCEIKVRFDLRGGAPQLPSYSARVQLRSNALPVEIRQ